MFKSSKWYFEQIENRLNTIEERAIHIEDKQDRIRKALIKLLSSRLVTANYGDEEIKYDFGIYGMWHTKNFGAALTSYAIYKLVESEGYSCVQLYLPQIGNNKLTNDKDNISADFIKKKCNVTDKINIEDAVLLNKSCKAFLVPSDSLFGGGYNYQLDALQGVLLGSAARKNRPIMSFSTSFGGWIPHKTDEIQEQVFKKLLKDFSHISLRERTGLDLAKNTFNVDASHTLDPVFLIDKSEFEKLVEDVHINNDEYIFAYIMSPTSEKMAFLKKYSEELNCKVCCGLNLNKQRIPDFDTTPYKDICFEESNSVEYWLCKIKNAKFVVTDSYHGFCFSLIFLKRFGILTPNTGEDRFTDLLDFLGLNKCNIVNNVKDVIDSVNNRINYKQVNEILKEKAEKDREELRLALKQCIKKTILSTSDMNYEELREQLILRKVLDILN